MPQDIKANSAYNTQIPSTTDTANILAAFINYHYGVTNGTAPEDNALTPGLGVVGLLNLKANLASPIFTGTVYAPTIKPAVSANTSLSLSTNNVSASAGNITLNAGNSTSAGNGGSITLTSGTSANSNPGNITLAAGSGTVNLTSTTVAVSGGLTVGGGYGSSGVTITSLGALSLDSTLTSGSNIVSEGKTSSVTEQAAGFFFGSSGQVQATRDNGTPIYAHRYGSISGSQTMIQFVYKGVLSGTIATTSAGTPAFVAASDYRIKTNITPITDAIERMKNAKAYTFYKNIDPTHTLQTGFIAHELAKVQSDLVVGEKDGVDKDGNPIYQEVMETKLIPVMAQAINDLIGLVEKLTSRIEELETK